MLDLRNSASKKKRPKSSAGYKSGTMKRVAAARVPHDHPETKSNFKERLPVGSSYKATSLLVVGDTELRRKRPFTSGVNTG